MTFKQKLLLSIAFTLPYTIFLAALSNTPMPTQTPTTKNKTAEKLPELKIKYDTIVVTAKNFDYVKHKIPGGVYNWQNNTIIISHFETDSQDDEIINYCRINQAHESLVLVHEKEHARKSHLTKKIHHLPDYTRAQIAALNEIVAPAAEIIAVLDYEYKNKQQHPFTYNELKEARDEIIALNKHKNNLSQTPTNFNDTRIANTVIKYAAKRFIRHSSDGTYLGTINTVAKKPNYYLKHTPSEETQKKQQILFYPDIQYLGRTVGI